MTRAAGEPVRPEPGRRVVLEPAPSGLWLLLPGAAVAALAPLLGFIVGGSIGVGDGTADISPMVLSLFIGIAIGGLGVLVALLGGMRLWRHYHRREVADEQAATSPRPSA